MCHNPIGLLGLQCGRKLPVIQLVKLPRVDGRNHLHGEVDVVEAALQAVEQELGDASGDGGGVLGLS